MRRGSGLKSLELEGQKNFEGSQAPLYEQISNSLEHEVDWASASIHLWACVKLRACLLLSKSEGSTGTTKTDLYKR